MEILLNLEGGNTNPVWLLVRVVPHGSGQPGGRVQTVILLPIGHQECRSHVELVDDTLSRWKHRFHDLYNTNKIELMTVDFDNQDDRDLPGIEIRKNVYISAGHVTMSD